MFEILNPPLKIRGLKIVKNRCKLPLPRYRGVALGERTSTRYASGHLLASQSGGCTLRCPNGTEHALDWRRATALDADPHESCPACGVPIGARLDGERSPFSALRAGSPGHTPFPPTRGGGSRNDRPA